MNAEERSRKNMKYIFAAVAAVVLLAGVFLYINGQANRKYVVGKRISDTDISEFYYTVATSTNPPFYQRYRLFRRNEGMFFYHETREGNSFPLTEADITVSGTVELDYSQWNEFYRLLLNGTVEKRSTDIESGSKGPWLYLYWKNDKGVYQKFSFASRQQLELFEELCRQLSGSSRPVKEK